MAGSADLTIGQNLLLALGKHFVDTHSQGVWLTVDLCKKGTILWWRRREKWPSCCTVLLLTALVNFRLTSFEESSKSFLIAKSGLKRNLANTWRGGGDVCSELRKTLPFHSATQFPSPAQTFTSCILIILEFGLYWLFHQIFLGSPKLFLVIHGAGYTLQF